MEKNSAKKKIVLLAGIHNWAFDFVARSIAKRLSDRFEFRILFAVDRPDLNPDTYDLLYSFFWGEQWMKKFKVPKSKLIREVSSHRWEHEKKYGRHSAKSFVKKYLNDCICVTATSRRLFERIDPLRPNVFFTPLGIETDQFQSKGKRQGPLTIGWVGNPEDPCKGLKDILIPATNGKFAFIHSDGKMTREEVAEFYNRIDVIAIASTFEGSPLPLIEGMVSGCFPVSTDVGIAPELIRHGENGLIVERSVEAFQEAFAWCEKNLDIVRAAGQRNAGEIPKARSWEKMIGGFEKVFDFALAWQKAMPEKPSRFSFLRRFFSA